MKLGINVGYSGARMGLPIARIQEMERLGYDSVWTAEAYGNDAVSTATWVLAKTTKIKVDTAIMQMPARTPAMTAMTAMTLDHLSGGRFLLGLGPSGPRWSRAGTACRTASRSRARASTSRSSARSSRARNRSSSTARSTTSPCAARARRGSASR